ncbi:unnamed protein product, partial [Didymodactylos carnosus]
MVDIGTSKPETVLFNEDLRKHDPDAECYMCRNSHIYVKPIGVQQKSNAKKKYEYSQQQKPLTIEEIDALSKKKQLTRQDVKKLLQCYFPDIKDAKYFQLHKYHSCCYDPEHINNSKNHITSFQHEKDDGHNHHSHDYKHHHHHDNINNQSLVDDGTNKVSFVRIKIEPTKGIPTRFLGPAALPESLADMLIKQRPSITPSDTPPYNVRRLTVSPYEQSTSLLSDQLSKIKTDDEDDGIESVDSTDDEGEQDRKDRETPLIQINSAGEFEGKVMDGSNINLEQYMQRTSAKQQSEIEARDPNSGKKSKPTKQKQHTKQEQKENKPLPSSDTTAKATKTNTKQNNDLIVEDLDGVKPWYSANNYQEQKPKKKKKKKRRKRLTLNGHEHDIYHLRHWEVKALEQAHQEPCGCRHHVTNCGSCEANHLLYRWCRCKDHQHELFMDDQRKRRQSVVTTFRSSEPTPAPPPPPTRPTTVVKTPPPIIKKPIMKSTGINATEPTTTELALAYDPSAVDYDMIQEVIYYRTSSGRLIKPEVSNAFTYDTMPQSMTLQNTGNYRQPVDVVYMLPNGEVQQIKGNNTSQQPTYRRRTMTGSSESLILSNGGSTYRGQVKDMNNQSIPLITIPSQTAPSSPYYYNHPNMTSPTANGYYSPPPPPQTTTPAVQWSPEPRSPIHHQPAEFTLVTVNNNRSPTSGVNKTSPILFKPQPQTPVNPTVPRVPTKSSITSPKSSNSSAKKSTTPNYIVKDTHNDPKKNSNNKNYIVKDTHNMSPLERESSILTHRRWFDQPLGDQNLEPLQESKYGLIAAGSEQEWISTGPKTVTFEDDDHQRRHHRKSNDIYNSEHIGQED